MTRLRNAAERVARTHGLDVFDVQLRREPIGMVLRVIIDRPDRGRVEAPEEAVGIDAGHVMLEEGRKTHRVPFDKIKRAHLDVEF